MRLTVLLAAPLLIASILPGGIAAGAADPTRPDDGGGATGPRGPITDLGEPVQKVQALSSAIGTGPDGEPQAYLLVEGNPTTTLEFAVVDLRGSRTVLDVRIEHGSGSQRTMDVSPTTGEVYFATSDIGELYRYRPGDDTVERIGQMLPGQRIWEIEVGDDGTVWGGTYPGGRLFSYHPDTGETVDHGQAFEAEQYIGAIGQVGDEIWVGTQPNGRVATYDPASGGFTEVAMPDAHSATQISTIQRRDDRVYVTAGGRTFVRDIATDAWVDRIDGVSGYGVSPPHPVTGEVYARVDGAIQRYDPATGELDSLGWRPNATPEDWAWVDLDGTGPSIALTYWNSGRIYAHNPQTGAGYYHQPDLMGAGTPIVALGAGPNGNIYAGGYLSPPGMARWDPDRGEFELLTGTSQVEGYGTFAGDLVFGRYPQGRLYRYDPDEPWESGTNPGPTVDLEPHGQNRPQSFVDLSGLPELDGTVAVASVPITGQHGGAITLWKPDTNEVEVHRHVVTDQTPVSLVEHGGLLYGGTSINGGYGVDPVTDEGVLFGWDPTTGETTFQIAPVPGAPTVSGLVVDKRRERLWGFAGGELFEFDLRTGTVLRRVELFDDHTDSRYGNEQKLLLHGRLLIGVTSNRVFTYAPDANLVRVLYDGPAVGDGALGEARHLAMDRNGDLYFAAQSTKVYRYRLDE